MHYTILQYIVGFVVGGIVALLVLAAVMGVIDGIADTADDRERERKDMTDVVYGHGYMGFVPDDALVVTYRLPQGWTDEQMWERLSGSDAMRAEQFGDDYDVKWPDVPTRRAFEEAYGIKPHV